MPVAFRARTMARLMSVLLLSAGLLGCATGRYQAGKLPAFLLAPPIENPQTVDLSRLAISTSTSDWIDRGDVLEVSISAGLSAQDNFTFPVRINDNGDANLPVIGTISLAGLELEGAEAAINAVCVSRGLYKNPHVTVEMKRQRMNRVTVVGAVKEPGIYEIPRGACDLLAAIVSAKGLAPDAGTHVEIRRPLNSARIRKQPDRIAGQKSGGVSVAGHSTSSEVQNVQPISLRVNLVSAAKAGTNGYRVEDGGIVMVEKRDPKPVYVMGLVKKPGRYEFPVAEDLRVLDAIALAGGVSSTVADKVFVIRRMPDRNEPAVVQLSIRKAKQNGSVNLRLMPGDTVTIEKTPATVLLDAIFLIRFGVGASLNTLF